MNAIPDITLPELPDVAGRADLPSQAERVQTGVIRRLSPEIVARIAAGEVVERPASVLKELVENALDAQAFRIVAELESGGMANLRVSDDGCGMSPEDLQLAVQPHATSKLNDADQLHALETLGFRGEALPSVASVSRFSIVSRRRPASTSSTSSTSKPSSDSAIAWRIDVEGGRPEIPEPRPAAGPFGTTVEARELFYNVPARQKFLKGLAAEASACADTFLRLALTRPDVAFMLKQGRSDLLNLPAAVSPVPQPASSGRSHDAQAAPELPASAYFRRAREALDRASAEGLIEVDFSDRSRAEIDTEDPSCASGPYRLFGLLSPPAFTRANRSMIYLTVNGRAVKDRTLTSALLEAFRHLLPPRRFPVAVLYLDVPGSDVDINVHPAKSEVRFRSPSRIYALFYHAVRSACGLTGRASADGATEMGPAAQDPVPRQTSVFNDPERSSSMRTWPSGSEWLRPSDVPAKNHQTVAWTKPLSNQASPSSASSPSSPAARAQPVLRADLKFVPAGPLFTNAPSTDTPDRDSIDALMERPATQHANAFDLWPRLPARPEADVPAASGIVRSDDPVEQLSELVLIQNEPARVQEQPPAPYGRLDAPPAADFRVIGQAAGSYIVLEDESGVRLIDQHALHERILFERLLTAAHAHSRGDAQGLLVPETIDLSAAQAALVSSGPETLELLAHLGFDCEPFGTRALLVRSVPTIVKQSSPARLVAALLEALAAGDDAPDGGSKALKRWTLREKAAYILSCKAAIKAGERLTHEQMTALMTEFQAVAGSFNAATLTCPHGRPLALEVSWYELEKAVGRK